MLLKLLNISFSLFCHTPHPHTHTLAVDTRTFMLCSSLYPQQLALYLLHTSTVTTRWSIFAYWIPGHKSYKVNKMLLYRVEGLFNRTSMELFCLHQKTPSKTQQGTQSPWSYGSAWPSSFYALFLLRFCPPATWRCLEQKTGSIWRGPVPFLPICFLLFYSGAVFSETFATYYKLSWRSLPTSPRSPKSTRPIFIII